MFIPHRVKSLLSESSWQSLLTNQPRLTSLLDLHHSLGQHLLGFFSWPEGGKM